MSIKSKMTAIADKMRDLLGITDKMGLDEMATNLDVCQSVVDTQAELLDQALSAIENKTSGETVVVTPVLQSKVVTPSEDEKVVVPDVGYDALSSVSVGAIDRSYVGSEVERMDESVITPGVDSQTIPSGIYLDGSQTILGDKDLIPENIKQGVDIFGVKGIYVGEDDGADMSDGDALETDIADGKVAYTKDGRVVGSLEVVESGYGYSFPACFYGIYGDGSKFSVDAIVSDKKIWDEGSIFTAEIESSDLGDAEADDVVAGKTFTSSSGVKIEGSVQLVDTDLSKNFIVSNPEIVMIDGVKHLGMVADVNDNTIFRSGSHVEIDTKASNLGNASVNDVVKGKTFTSENGINLVGKGNFVDISPHEIATGSFQVTTSSYAYKLSHNAGFIPDFITIFTDTDVDASGFKSCVVTYSLCRYPLGSGYEYISQYSFIDKDGVWRNGSSYVDANDLTDNDATLYMSETFKIGVTYYWFCGALG